MNEFVKTRDECRSKRVLWEDPDFVAEDSNLFYHDKPNVDFSWKRPKEIVSNPKFVIDNRSKYDIIPGKLGESYLVSVLGVLYQFRELFYRSIPADQGFDEDFCYAGVFHFRLWWAGEWTEVLVDDRLPVVNGELYFIHSEGTNQFWAALLEKAYAKLHGSYEALKYATSTDAFNELTGGATERLPVKPEDACLKLVSKALKQTAITSAISFYDKKPNAELHPDRHYCIFAMEEIQCTDGTSIIFVKVQTSPGIKNTYDGPFSSPRSPDWKKVLPKDRERMKFDTLNSGEFWMIWQEFRNLFESIEVVYLDADTCQSIPRFQQRHIQPPHTRIFQGFWKKGITAGGCRNNIETFHVNPQVLVGVTHPADVVIALIQHQTLEPRVMGFSIYEISGDQLKGSQLMGTNFFRSNKAIYTSNYCNSRQVLMRVWLEARNYLVIPTAYKPGSEGTFTMRVYSQVQISLGNLDTSPIEVLGPAIIRSSSSSDDYKNMFLSFADEKKTINAYELQELLHSCLPNDYVKSCANMDVCRRAIQALNPSQHLGRIGYSQFKNLTYSLKVWQEIFGSYSKAGGVLKAERLREALADVGFQLSTDIMHLLLLRYMKRDGTLRFGDFVSTILHLVAAFNTFSRKLQPKTDVIQMNSKDWMKSVLRC